MIGCDDSYKQMLLCGKQKLVIFIILYGGVYSELFKIYRKFGIGI